MQAMISSGNLYASAGNTTLHRSKYVAWTPIMGSHCRLGAYRSRPQWVPPAREWLVRQWFASSSGLGKVGFDMILGL